MWWKTVLQLEWKASLLPSNATPWERVIEGVDTELVARDPVGLIAASRSPSAVPLPLLPYLAAERSVDEFSGHWPENMQRAVVAEALPYHKVKATRGALERGLAPLGYSIRIVEWFQATSWRPPNTFRIEVTLAADVGWSAQDRDLLARVANWAKAAHTLMAGMDIKRHHQGTIRIAAKFRRRRTLRVGQVPRIITHRQSSHVFTGIVQRRRRTLRIGARQ